MPINNDVSIWMNQVGDSGKSLGFRLGGTTFIAPVSQVKELMNEEREGVSFSPIVGDDDNDDAPDSQIVNEVDFWMNRIGEKSLGFEMGGLTYISSMSTIRDLINGEQQGVSFSPIIPDEDEE